MTDQIEPALTPEQWRVNGFYHNRFEAYYIGHSLVLHENDAQGCLDERIEVPVDSLPAVAALTNAALPENHPLKITHTHIIAVAIAAQHARERFEHTPDDLLDRPIIGAQVTALDNLAAVLFAYLRPST